MLDDIEHYQNRVEELEIECEQHKTVIAKFRKVEHEYAKFVIRKPLSFDEIKNLYYKVYGKKRLYSELDMRFALAIEQAHGIGEDK